MIGLIRKDMYCLRKNLILFVNVTSSIIVLAVLFLLSSKYGNIAKGVELMKSEQVVAETEIFFAWRVAVWVILFIPMSFVSMIVECFKEDCRAGFGKYAFSMPVGDAEIVGGRYVSCLFFALVGLMGSMTAALCISTISGIFEFKELLGYIISFCAILLIYMSFVMFMLYLLGAARADFVQCAPFVMVLAAAIAYVQIRLRSIPAKQVDAVFNGMVQELSCFMAEKCMVLFLTALVCMGISFAGAVKCVEQRREKG